MSNFKSTIWAYDYYLEDGLFKNLVLPDGIDKDTLISVIMQECGEMQPTFTNAEFMQDMIGYWSTKWAATFEKWIAAVTAEYDPISNYDRHEEWTDQLYHTVGGSAETKKSSYDSATLTPYDKVETSDSGNSFDTRNGHTYGNIGVTSSQQLLEAEYKVAEWNIYEHIKDLFMQDFCIMIY